MNRIEFLSQEELTNLLEMEKSNRNPLDSLTSETARKLIASFDSKKILLDGIESSANSATLLKLKTVYTFVVSKIPINANSRESNWQGVAGAVGVLLQDLLGNPVRRGEDETRSFIRAYQSGNPKAYVNFLHDKYEPLLSPFLRIFHPNPRKRKQNPENSLSDLKALSKTLNTYREEVKDVIHLLGEPLSVISKDDQEAALENCNEVMKKISQGITEVREEIGELARLSDGDKEKIFSYEHLLGFKKTWKLLRDQARRELTWNIIALLGSIRSCNMSFIENAYFTVEGVALIASYLKQKKGIRNLFVISDSNQVIDEIRRIAENPEDQKVAFITEVEAEGLDLVKHKVAYCVEKKNGILTLISLDSLGESTQNNDLISEVREFVKNLGSKGNYFENTIKRERSYYGCTIFALQDAIGFLADDHFFEKITYQMEGWKKAVTTLPPVCMVGTQSVSQINAYMKERNEKSTILPGKNKSLQKYLKKYTLTGISNEGEQKKQNHYVTNKHYKYIWLINCFIDGLAPEKLEAMVCDGML